MANTKKKKKKQHRFFWFMIKLQIFLMVCILGGLGYYYFGGYASQVEELRVEANQLVDNSTDETFVPSRTSTIYDSNENVISELSGEKDADYVKYEDIPAAFGSAMVSIEDKKFYSHNGIDFKAILRAAKAIVQDGRISQGGSTITMQLSRNIFLDMSKNWQRKVKEMFVSLKLEKKYSKNKIMEFYLNNIYFANGYYGVGAACKGYFNCELKELSLSQIAFLCAIPNSPTYYDPLVNMDHTITRRNLILDNMYEDGKISADEYKKAKDEKIELNVPKEKKKKKDNSLSTYAYYCATRALMQNEGFKFKTKFDSDKEKEDYDKEYDEMYAYCQKKLYSDGYKIYTSIDTKKQKELQKAVDSTLKDFKEKSEEGVYSMQGAAVSIDNETGQVIAIVGGRSQDFSGLTLNRAYQSHRQPGSSIKPLVVYTPSFENGYTPDSKVNDHKFEGGPSNSGGSYYGQVPIRFAVAKSLNTVAWQLYSELTPEVGLSYLQNMNFGKIVENDFNPATSLGGFTNGVSPLEMASAYATIENDGKYREPTCIVSIIDADENIIYASEQKEEIVYTETASRMMTECMEGVMENGTGARIKLKNMPCAGKTGTTNEQKDGWFCGFTRYYTTCVWVGCDIPKAVQNLQGASYPGQIWNTYMESIHEGLTPMEFLPYAKVSDQIDNSETEETETQETETQEPIEEPDDDDAGQNEPVVDEPVQNEPDQPTKPQDDGDKPTKPDQGNEPAKPTKPEQNEPDQNDSGQGDNPGNDPGNQGDSGTTGGGEGNNPANP